MEDNRARLMLQSGEDAYTLVERLRGLEDAFSIENRNGMRKVDAKSLLGVICSMLESMDEMYLVNETHAGWIPASIGCFLAANA